MNNEAFRKNLDDVHEKIELVLGAKGEEYATDTDRLHNFKIADGKPHSMEKWDEKIIDHINYLILLRAIVVEEAEVARRKVLLDVNTIHAPQGAEYEPKTADPNTETKFIAIANHKEESDDES